MNIYCCFCSVIDSEFARFVMSRTKRRVNAFYYNVIPTHPASATVKAYKRRGNPSISKCAERIRTVAKISKKGETSKLFAFFLRFLSFQCMRLNVQRPVPRSFYLIIRVIFKVF